MNRIILVITIFTILVSCQSNQGRQKISKTAIIKLEENQQILKGKITRKQFINKGNRKVEGVYDYYTED